MDGAFHSNKFEYTDLQEAVVLRPLTVPIIKQPEPHVGAFKTDEDRRNKANALPSDDAYLTHPKYSDGTVMEETMFAIGDLEQRADHRRATAMGIGYTNKFNHTFFETLREPHYLDQ
jgi:hypothetical protein